MDTSRISTYPQDIRKIFETKVKTMISVSEIVQTNSLADITIEQPHIQLMKEEVDRLRIMKWSNYKYQ